MQKLQSYIETIQCTMRLHAWNIYVAEEESDDDCNASIHFISGRRYATIRFHKGWEEDRTPEDKRHDVVHELLHVMHHDTDDNLFRFFDDNGDIGSYVASIVMDQASRDLERMVDALANFIAPLMPEWEDE